MLNKFISSALDPLYVFVCRTVTIDLILVIGARMPAAVPACMILDRDFPFSAYSSSLQQAQTLNFAADHSPLGAFPKNIPPRFPVIVNPVMIHVRHVRFPRRNNMTISGCSSQYEHDPADGEKEKRTSAVRHEA
ncbi:hypothetical protein C8J57DRAFT_1240704 [Mycena rebaudengoi]|nr:hypothetical protein C8J57DRAFT_1240704 [Mycena rebaudengoi]